MSYAVVARYVCRPEDADDIRAALLEMRKHTLAEPANRAYVVHEVADADAAFLLYEVYDDEAGFQAHAASPHFERLIAGRVRPKLLDRRVDFAHVL
ncbi:quinol monooxygenase YgiN [Mumia flava]|uniref:Quinol monooxygenase YgiN n=1 Tax=Mumia flava TaxID=1348852 RepID=A0A0B2BEC0_9ACTN|nr:antibiotic biosynthesis monooxygenase [Mumia flava]PJJ48238.1 quinol monooxygenase YgiN [Mumia flava]